MLQLLPPIHKYPHLIPAAEHTVLLPLSILALASCTIVFTRLSSRTLEKAWMVACALAAAYLVMLRPWIDDGDVSSVWSAVALVLVECTVLFLQATSAVQKLKRE